MKVGGVVQDVQVMPAGAPDAQPRSRQVLGAVALVFSILGIGLSAVGCFGVAVPGQSFDSSFYLVAYGSLGVFPGLVGLVLGLVAYVPARRRGRREPISRWAAILGAIALLLLPLSILAAQVYWWLA
jgi:hypothetical protein